MSRRHLTIVRPAQFRHPAGPTWARPDYEAAFAQLEQQVRDFQPVAFAAITGRSPDGAQRFVGAAGGKAVIIERAGPARDRVLADITAGADAIDAQAAADTAALDELAAIPPAIPTNEDLNARHYWAGLARTELENLTPAQVVAVVNDQLPELVLNPQRAAAWADLLEALKVAAERSFAINRVPRPADAFEAAAFGSLIEVLKAPALDPANRAAFELRPTLPEVRNLVRFVKLSAPARINDMLLGGGNTSREQARNRFANVWTLGSLGVPNLSRTYGAAWSTGDELAIAMAKATGLRGMGAWG